MKKVLKIWESINPIIKILCGIIIGVGLALLVPKATFISVFGNVFVGALKAVAPVLVFILVINSISSAKNSFDKRFGLVISLYLVTTLIASVIAVVASFIFKIKLPLNIPGEDISGAPQDIATVLNTLLTNVVLNPIDSIVKGNYLGILFWAILLGIALRKANDTTKQVLQDLTDAVSTCVKWIISFAPFGILGLSFTAVSQNGLAIFTDYGLLLALIVGCMLVVALVVNPILSSIIIGKNAYPLAFRCIKESGLMAFFTRSSAANIPVNMRLCENLGLDKDMYSVSIPLGATINMDGAAITIAVMSLVGAFSSGVNVPIWQALLLSLLATIAACGASGVAGGSLLLIPLACSLLGVSDVVAMQMVGIGFIIGVVQDSVETALNSSGDVLFAATAEFSEWRKQGKEIKF